MSWRSASKLAWLRGLPGIREKEPLASRTSFGIGGPADFFLEAGRAETIEKVLDGCRERTIPYLLLVLLVISFGLTGLGFMIAWQLDSTQGFHAIMNLVLIPMWLMSGALFPVQGAPAWLLRLND